jgi:hypothetical protein
MAKTIATAYGYDSERTKETHRLGSRAAGAEVATWQTFIDSHIVAEGQGSANIKRGNERVGMLNITTPESATDSNIRVLATLGQFTLERVIGYKLERVKLTDDEGEVLWEMEVTQ